MTNRRKYKPNPISKAVEIITDEWNKEEEVDNVGATYAATFILIVMVILITVTTAIIGLLV